MREKDGFFHIPLLPQNMREQMRRLPANKKQWPRDFLDKYRRAHADLTSSKAEFLTWARKDRDRRMTRTAKVLLSYLVDCVNFDSGRCDPSQQTIADEIGVCTRTVERVIKQLSAAGWLEVYRRGKTATNFYQLRVTAEKVAAIEEDSGARREVRKAASNRRVRPESDPTYVSDHSENDPTRMSAHDPTSMSVRDPTRMSDKPMNRTSEDEPLNENKINHAKEGTYTREDIPTQESDFNAWISRNIPDRAQHREAYRLLRERKMTPELWRRMAA
jgi:hypothetical protein